MDEPFKGYFSNDNFARVVVELVPSYLEKFEFSDLLNNGPFLDLGCGLGHIVDAFQRRYPNLPVIGVDGNLSYLHEARRRNSYVHLVHAHFEKLPINNRSIPLVFSHKIYESENEETYPEIAREIDRILTIGGVYFSIEYMRDYKDPFLSLGLEIMEDNRWWTIFRKN